MTDDIQMMPATSDTKCGFVALIGVPNSGKSTLINQLVGAKVSIVTHKVQTTRARVRGIVMEGPVQLVMVDTPGIFKPRRMLDRAMVSTAWGEAGEADAIVLMIDAKRGLEEGSNKIIEGLAKSKSNSKKPIAIALNKVDRVKRDDLLALAQSVNDAGIAERIFMISALKGDGVQDLLEWCSEKMPDGPWLFDPDTLSDQPQRLLAAEITREKLYLRLHKELPYASTVETEQWEQRDDGSVRIDQTIFVDRDSQKPIIVGRKGATLKSIGAEARKELEALLGHRVHLFIHVKVREKWAEEQARLREIGLDIMG